MKEVHGLGIWALRVTPPSLPGTGSFSKSLPQQLGEKKCGNKKLRREPRPSLAALLPTKPALSKEAERGMALGRASVEEREAAIRCQAGRVVLSRCGLSRTDHRQLAPALRLRGERSPSVSPGWNPGPGGRGRRAPRYCCFLCSLRQIKDV